jgi:hypothetical protein
MCAGDGLANAGSASGIRRPASSLAGGKMPIRIHVRRPERPPLLYFAAVLPVRFVRISLLTCGAKRARTADLLHAMNHQQVTDDAICSANSANANSRQLRLTLANGILPLKVPLEMISVASRIGINRRAWSRFRDQVRRRC